MTRITPTAADAMGEAWSKKTASAVPNPGSDAALALGCKCAVIDNGHGRGYRGQPDVFVISGGCPVHCPQEPKP